MFLKSVSCLVLVVSFFAASPVMAQEDFTAWKETFKREALQQGVRPETLHKFLPRMTLLPQVVQADKKQPEFISTFWDYMDKRLTQAKIQEGQMLLKRYPSWLKRISEAYGVPPEYIIAFWGLETNYGKTMGNTDVLKALTTLAYNPRRRKFFTRELIAFLKILEKEKWESVKGSWAGAFGHFQFMPTTFEAYAVDADNNGTRNIMVSMPDAFSSAANYLHQMGWNPAETWGQEVVLPAKVDWNKIHNTKEQALQAWINQGFQPVDSGWKISSDTKASLVMPMGKSGPVFLVFPNFKRVMRWNKSELYALSVCFLADALANRWNGIQHPRTEAKISTEQIYQMQERLKELGYYHETPDGLVGSKTRAAILAFQKANKLDEDGHPSKELFYLLNTYGKEQNK